MSFTNRPAMLKWNSRQMTSFAAETGHHLLRSAFSTNIERLSNCAGSNENKYFLRQGVHAILKNSSFFHAGGRNAQGCLYLMICHMTILLSSSTASMFPDTTAVFGRTSRSSSLSVRRPQLKSLNQLFTVL